MGAALGLPVGILLLLLMQRGMLVQLRLWNVWHVPMARLASIRLSDMLLPKQAERPEQNCRYENMAERGEACRLICKLRG